MKTSTDYIASSIRIFRQYKQLADASLNRLTDSQFFDTLRPDSNSAAVVVKHMAGNMISRWTDFLTADGEKAFRNRDDEFEITAADRIQLMQQWEKGWNILFHELEQLTAADLGRLVKIRSEDHSVMEAINRQLAHYSYHVGQIVFICKALIGDQWKSLSIAKGKSKDFNNSMNHQ